MSKTWLLFYDFFATFSTTRSFFIVQCEHNWRTLQLLAFFPSNLVSVLLPVIPRIFLLEHNQKYPLNYLNLDCTLLHGAASSLRGISACLQSSGYNQESDAGPRFWPHLTPYDHLFRSPTPFPSLLLKSSLLTSSDNDLVLLAHPLAWPPEFESLWALFWRSELLCYSSWASSHLTLLVLPASHPSPLSQPSIPTQF